ncbi:multifunctional expression regulator [Wood mouse herpesvirus]|uniref:Multifunctional expression regulator n=1 Tax=Wood mouse herpesvirus TaxID=432370 RepID=D0U1P6_9GAMA|nr:multifunctional expression regulator [Wood mouse herpesvirus]ACY41127.1 multifunctional expression regulator [Wood mouse herpesvirus]
MAQQMLEAGALDHMMEGLPSDFDFDTSDEEGELSDSPPAEESTGPVRDVVYEPDPMFDDPPPTPSPDIRSPSPKARKRALSPEIIHNSPLLRDTTKYEPATKRSYSYHPRRSPQRENPRQKLKRGTDSRRPNRWNQKNPKQYWSLKPLLDYSKIPRAEYKNAKLLVPTTGKLRPEFYTDRFVDAIIQNAARNCPVSEKAVSLKNIEESFKLLHSFFNSGINKEPWLSTRYFAIFNNGLVVLTHMLDEQMAWAYACLKHGRELPTDDILMSTSEKLSQQLVIKLMEVIKCIEKDGIFSRILKGVADAVCLKAQFLRGMITLKRTPCSLPMYTLFVYVLTIPTLRTRVIRDPLLTQCKDVVLKYQPGDCITLLKAALNCHQCNKDCDKCKYILDPLLGQTHRTKGVFFVCE